MDIRIDSETTVRDACLESDELVASLSRVVKGAEPVSIRYLDDGTCEVRMEVKKQDVVRAVSNSSKGRTHTTRIEDSVRENSFIETGRGAMHPVLQGAGVPAGVAEPAPPDNAPQDKNAGADVFFETETIIRRLLESKPVQR
jgi:hypothetical protein